MWIRTENSEDVRPVEREISGNTAFLRRAIKRVAEEEDRPAHYVYEEWQMTKEQYEIFRNFEEQISEQSDALVELAELISEVL